MIVMQVRAGPLSSLKEDKLKIGEDVYGAYLYFEKRPYNRLHICIPEASCIKPSDIIEAFEDMRNKAMGFDKIAKEVSEVSNKPPRRANIMEDECL
mgnify:CR=1 FL=1